MTGISVFILEDDAATRASLVRRINASPQLEICGTADSIAAARSALIDFEPDVLLADLNLPDGKGTEIIAEQTARRPTMPILVISVFGDEESVVSALAAGAQGYLLKDDSGEEVADAIHQVMNGLSPISPAIATHLIRRFKNDVGSPPQSGQSPAVSSSILSARELDVLRLASKGLSYQETADAMNVSVNTVGTYTRRVYTKLAVNSRAEALFEARQLGLMTGDG